MSVPIRIIDARTGKPIDIDRLSGSFPIIDSPHHKIHEGEHFIYSFTDADWDTADAQEILIVTGKEKAPHVLFRVAASLDTSVALYEDATHTPGAERVAYNNNRENPLPATTKLYSHADDGADGTLIFSDQFGSSGGILGLGVTHMDIRRENEFILRRNSKYLLVVSTGTDNSSLGLVISWYESEGK